MIHVIGNFRDSDFDRRAMYNLIKSPVENTLFYHFYDYGEKIEKDNQEKVITKLLEISGQIDKNVDSVIILSGNGEGYSNHVEFHENQDEPIVKLLIQNSMCFPFSLRTAQNNIYNFAKYFFIDLGIRSYIYNQSDLLTNCVIFEKCCTEIEIIKSKYDNVVKEYEYVAFQRNLDLENLNDINPKGYIFPEINIYANAKGFFFPELKLSQYFNFYTELCNLGEIKQTPYGSNKTENKVKIPIPVTDKMIGIVNYISPKFEVGLGDLLYKLQIIAS